MAVISIGAEALHLIRGVGQAFVGGTMTPRERAIRDGLAHERLTPDEALPLVDSELACAETPSLLVLRGILIQVSEGGPLTLDDARTSFERAIELAPDYPEAYEELGHLHDAVLPDRDKAEKFYRLALAKGAGASCQEALDELLAEGEGGACVRHRIRGVGEALA